MQEKMLEEHGLLLRDRASLLWPGREAAEEIKHSGLTLILHSDLLRLPFIWPDLTKSLGKAAYWYSLHRSASQGTERGGEGIECQYGEPVKILHMIHS